MNKRNTRNKRKRILSFILAAALLAAGIPVQAAAFEPAVDAGGIFSAGEDTDIFTDSATGEITPPAEIPQDEPKPSVTPSPTVPPSLDTTPTPSITPEPTGTPSPSVTPTPIPEGSILVRFADSDGTYYENLDQVIRWGDELELPNVPGRPVNMGNFWKPEKDKNIDDTFPFDGGDKLIIRKDESWDRFMKDGVLTFYAAKKCKVTLYNNSGTAVFENGVIEAYEGESVLLPDMPSDKYINKGWTTARGDSTVVFDLNSTYRVLDDLNLYMVRYTAVHVTFRLPDGSNADTFEELNMKVQKNTKITIPEAPRKKGYSNPGWSKSKNDTKCSFWTGRRVTITKDITFYAVRVRLPYTVKFNNNSGSSTSKVYTSMTIYADKDQKIVLPKVPKAAGYQNLGWTTEKGKTAPLYKEGETVKVKKSMRFYAVRRKSRYYTVEFFAGNGKTNSAYKKLNMKVEEGTEITFPLVPAKTGYINKGWARKPHSSVANVAQTHVVTKNIKVYAVQVKAAKVTLHKVTGEVYQTTTLESGASYTLPCVKNASGYTFLGWSDKPNQHVNPQYEPEMKITVKEDTDLYAVVFAKSKEQDIPSANLPQMDFYKYKRVVYVGDSRTAYMQNVLKKSGVTSGLEFICEVGKGLEWFKTVGYPELYNIVKNESTSILQKPTAVIFNLGVNDLENQDRYVLYLNSIAAELQKHNCKLYIMSVNPVNRSMLKAAGKKDRSEAKIRVFNNTMKSALGGKYKFIDTYSYLKDTGYGFDSSSTGVGGYDDGLHYTDKTYKRIYSYCMKSLQ